MTRYEQGFIKRASELGYDGAAILKTAARAPVPKTGLAKVKGILREYFGHLSGSTVRKARADLGRASEASRKNRSLVDKYNELFNKRNSEFFAKNDMLYNKVPGDVVPSLVRGNHRPVRIRTYKLVAKRGLPDSMWVDAEKARAARDAIGKHVDRLDKEYVDLIRPARVAAKERLSEALRHRENARLGTAFGVGSLAGGVGLGSAAANAYNDGRKEK